MNHEQLRQALASYVLGSLSAVERRQVEAHLAGCPDCRRELSSYAAVPGLLSRLDVHEVQGASLLPPASLLSSTLAAVERERRSRHRQLNRWRAGAGALAVAASLAAVLTLPTGGSPPDTGQSLTSAAGVRAQGSVELQARDWGTQVQLRLTGLPPAKGFEAFAVDRSGGLTLAASWGPTTSGRAQVPAVTPLSGDALAGVVIKTSEGRELLRWG